MDIQLHGIERSVDGLMSEMHAGEGLVCRFTGPETVFIQVKLIFFND